MRNKSISGLLIVLLSLGMATANAEVSEKAREAKDATVHAAKKTGEAVSDAASTAVATTKRAAHATADVAVKVYDKTKQFTKDAIGTAAEKTRETAGKVEDSVKSK